jgi:hypothetical protein
MKKLMFIISLLSVFAITNAQTDENIILSTEDVQKNELKVTPEIEKMMVLQIKNRYESDYSEFGIKSKEQLDNLQFGKPIPKYYIVNEELETVYIFNASRFSDEKPLSLKFTNNWIVPVMSDGEPLSFGNIAFADFGGHARLVGPGIENTIERFHNYEYKDLIIGTLFVAPSYTGMDHLIIRKENKDIFVQIYDEATGEYFKNEYSFSELINHIKELDLRRREARMRYYEKIADKSELIITPEIREMLDNAHFSNLKNRSDNSDIGITNRAQLENLQFGKPIPEYIIINEKLTFIGTWEVPVMLSDGEPLFMTTVRLGDDGQYSSGRYGGGMLKMIHNYEYKDLIIGLLGIRKEREYFIIRREHKDIFVKIYDYDTRESLKTEYSFSELINLVKK